MSKKLHWIDTNFLYIEFTTEMYVKKDVKFDNFWSLAYSCNVDTMSTSNESGYWAVTFPTIYFTTSIKSELTRKTFLFHMQYCCIIPHPTLLHYCRIAKVSLVALFRKYVEHKVVGIWPCTLLHCLIYGRIYSSNLVNK